MRHFTLGMITSVAVSLSTAGLVSATVQLDFEKPGTALQAEAPQPPGEGGQQQPLSAAPLTSEQIRTLQQSLRGQGVELGPIDGIMGVRTKQGLREFQQEKGLAATGKVDKPTLEALHLEVEKFMEVTHELEAAPENRPERRGIPREEPQQQPSREDKV